MERKKRKKTKKSSQDTIAVFRLLKYTWRWFLKGLLRLRTVLNQLVPHDNRGKNQKSALL